MRKMLNLMIPIAIWISGEIMIQIEEMTKEVYNNYKCTPNVVCSALGTYDITDCL